MAKSQSSAASISLKASCDIAAFQAEWLGGFRHRLYRGPRRRQSGRKHARDARLWPIYGLSLRLAGHIMPLSRQVLEGDAVPKVKVSLGERSYYVHVERGASKRVAEYLPKGTKATRALVVSDENVAPLYGGRVAKSFEAAGIETSITVMPAGEEEKNLRTVERLYHEMVDAEIDRQSIIVAVGGGVVGDVAGFAAATYMRGLLSCMSRRLSSPKSTPPRAARPAWTSPRARTS